MSYEAKVFRVLIASPSDVHDEREIAVKTIQEWNDLNSAERQIVLLPLRWETHTAPEYGKRPQEVINRQMVDHCDLLIGAFWTRIGSPTGVADSGTLEEIERVAGQGKPVMLYFSQSKKDPDDIDLDQLKALRDFKKKTFPKALVENYSSQIEFRDKLAKQIEIQLRSLIVSDPSNKEQGTSVSDIQLEFCEIDNSCSSGKEISASLTYIDVSDVELLPDYVISGLSEEQSEKSKKISVVRTNRDFYRQYIDYLVKESMHIPVKFWLKNIGYVGARDIFIDMKIQTNIESLQIESLSLFENDRPERESDVRGFRLTKKLFGLETDDDLHVVKKNDYWNCSIELRALQPKREVCPKDQMIISAKESGEILIEADIYADTLSEPIKHQLKINLTVDTVEVTATELLNQNGIMIDTQIKESA